MGLTFQCKFPRLFSEKQLMKNLDFTTILQYLCFSTYYKTINFKY